MIDHLNNFDPSAGECLEINRAVFHSLFSAATEVVFAQQVGAFAFGDALTTLQSAASAKGILLA